MSVVVFKSQFKFSLYREKFGLNILFSSALVNRVSDQFFVLIGLFLSRF